MTTDAAFLRAVAEKLMYTPGAGHDDVERVKRIAEKLANIPGYSSCEVCEELFPDDELDEDHRCEVCAEEAGHWATADGA